MTVAGQGRTPDNNEVVVVDKARQASVEAGTSPPTAEVVAVHSGLPGNHWNHLMGLHSLPAAQAGSSRWGLKVAGADDTCRVGLPGNTVFPRARR